MLLLMGFYAVYYILVCRWKEDLKWVILIREMISPIANLSLISHSLLLEGY